MNLTKSYKALLKGFSVKQKEPNIFISAVVNSQISKQGELT